MISIKVDDEFLDVGKISVSFELLSPLFNEMGSFSYPFTLPVTAKNKRLLGFHNRINYYPSNASFQTEIYLNGILCKRCKMILTESNNDTFKLYFVADEGYFYYDIKDIWLKQINLGGERLLYDYVDLLNLNEMFSNVYNNLYPNVDFAIFPVADYLFFDQVPGVTGYSNYINYWTPENKLNNDFENIVIYPYVGYLVSQIAQHFGNSLTKNDFSKVAELNQLCLHSNNPIMWYHYNNQILIASLKVWFNLQKVVPDILVTDLLHGLEHTFGAFLFYNELKKELSLRLFTDIIDSPPVDLPNVYRLTNIRQNTFEGYSVEWENDADDQAVETYIKGVAPTLNYRGALPTFEDMPETGDLNDYYYITWYGSYWGYKVSNITGNVTRYRISSYTNIISGKGTKMIRPNACLVNWPTVYGSSWEHVFYEKMGNHLLSGNEYKDTPLRFMFYRGMISGRPAGGHFSTQRTYSLNWEGTSGIYEKFWKRPLEFFQNTREGEFSMIFNPEQLKTFDFGKTYRFMDANWLLSSIKFTVTNNRISPSIVRAYKL